MFNNLFLNHKEDIIALYGLGTETERVILNEGKDANIIGLLDGFRTEGEMYGYSIISLDNAIEKKVSLIVVVARPGSCKAITNRIGKTCRENDIALYDIRGNDLLAPKTASFSFSPNSEMTRSFLVEKIKKADVINFDLFDTLVMRKLFTYTDVFEIVDRKLAGKGIMIPDLAKERLQSEKELSKKTSPYLSDIYKDVLDRTGITGISAEELAQLEWQTDLSLLLPRYAMCDIFKEAVSMGKHVVITTDSYYRQKQIEQILQKFSITGYDKVFVSCEYGTTKTQDLFDEVLSFADGKRILHIGDDEYSDIEKASAHGISTFRIYSGVDLFDLLGGMGIEESMHSLSDRVKTGLFISRIFNDPFRFETSENRISVYDAKDVGYIFCAPMIADFTFWMNNKVAEGKIQQLLLGARDGYLLKKLFDEIRIDVKYDYFLTSRTSAIRAGVECDNDISYIESMKYSGTLKEAVKKRFGIEINDQDSENYKDMIIQRAKGLRDNYLKYADKLGIIKDNMALFDFVAKGTAQLYLQKIFEKPIKGLYFLQLETEFMADKGLVIEPFYTEEEKNSSSIYDHYYILETILTSFDPQVEEFDSNGEPVYAEETRSNEDICCVQRAQEGILEYFKDLTDILPDSKSSINKQLDEKLLALIEQVSIKDEAFLNLKVEDPFFGRMTDLRTLL